MSTRPVVRNGKPETKAGSSKKGPKVLKLTKIKQWMMPVDASSYKTLRSLGLPLTRFHEKLLPTIKLLLDKKRIKVETISFQEDILDPFLDKVALSWQKIDVPVPSSLKCTVSSKEMSFISKGNFERAREAIGKLEGVIDTFFTRWGYTYVPTLSEGKGKSRIKYHVAFELSSEKMPVITVAPDEPEVTETFIEFGRTRLVFKFGEQNRRAGISRAPEVTLRVEISQGGCWNSIHTQHCLYTEVSSVLPLLVQLVKVPNFNHDNLDEE